MDKSIHDGSYPPIQLKLWSKVNILKELYNLYKQYKSYDLNNKSISTLLSINQLIIKSPLLILFLILSISITKPSYAVSSSILDKLLSNYCISKKGSSICSSDEEAQFLRDGTNRCKCGGWKYWSRDNRLCTDCPIDSIRNEDNLDSCRKIICPAGYGGVVIHDGRCPGGYGVTRITNNKCPGGLGIWSFDPYRLEKYGLFDPYAKYDL